MTLNKNLLPPPLEQYLGQQADILIPSQDGWVYECIILSVDELLKNNFWVKDKRGYEHLVPAYLSNFLFDSEPIDLSAHMEIVEPDSQ